MKFTASASGDVYNARVRSKVCGEVREKSREENEARGVEEVKVQIRQYAGVPDSYSLNVYT